MYSLKYGFVALIAGVFALSTAAYAGWRVNPSSPALNGGYLNLRDGPGQGHRILASIPGGAYVNQVGPCIRADDGGLSHYQWCNVEWGGTSGWVSMGGLVQAN